MDDLEESLARRPGKFYPWSPDNPEPFSPAGKNQSEGDGERKVAWEFRRVGARKNAAGENAFPDLTNSLNAPFGEVKAVPQKRPRVNMGRHSEFSDSVRKIVYDSVSAGQKVEFEVARKILGGYIGIRIISEHLTVGEWARLQQEFLRSYVQSAGGKVFLVSEEGYVLVDDSCWDCLEVYSVTSSAVVVRPKKYVLPFA